MLRSAPGSDPLDARRVLARGLAGPRLIPRAARLLAFAALIPAVVACGDAGPTGPGPLLRVDSHVASFDHLELTVLELDDGWVSPSVEPAPGQRFVTVRVRLRNRSGRVRITFHDHFDIEADNGLRRDATGPLRNPLLFHERLVPGASITKWLTFVLPVDREPARLVWTPENPFPDVDATLVVDLP